MKNSTLIDAKFVAIRDFYNKMKELDVRMPEGFTEWMRKQDVYAMYDFPSGMISGRLLLANESRYLED